MTCTLPAHRPTPWTIVHRFLALPFVMGLLAMAGCASGSATAGTASGTASRTASVTLARIAAETAPSPDPRVGLGAGLFDAEEAIWNMRLLSATPPPQDFVGITNSDLAFRGNYAFQGNYNGIQVWDIEDPRSPLLVTGYVCPASQSDVSVYGDLLFVSGEGRGGRLDCGTEGVEEAVSAERLRGIRIFDISDIRNPQYVANVQTCRGSHTHTLLKDPNDDENVYIYVSGSSRVRPAEELAGCSDGSLEENPNTARFRIEVIRVPLANPERAAIVSSPRIFADLVAPPQHGPAPEELAAIEEARANGAFVADFPDGPQLMPARQVAQLLNQFVAERGGSGAPTAADSTALRAFILELVVQAEQAPDPGPRPGPTQCHDITVYPEIGLAGGACGGYGFLIDISDPVNPERIAAVSDENFSYWHSATFNNDGTKILFSDEWGGGGQPKCRATDPKEWGSNAIFTLESRRMEFQGYYKLSAPQTPEENCVAHNGSLIPIPGRDVMVQAWYQGGVSVFDWTDPRNPVEIAFHDRGPVNPERMQMGGSWSVYWYNGVMVSSEIARGLDIFELTPSALLSQNEIDAAKSVTLDYLNAQGQPKFVWPTTFALAGAYLDQLERSGGLSSSLIESTRRELAAAESAPAAPRREALTRVADELSGEASGSGDAAKVRMLSATVRELGSVGR
ncbi:MAG: hypothetical protein IIB37_11550 [Gemmatimonadetes bacterium]|nr:hypothetical protein [Gemmatimonadota bacterium]